MTLAISVLSGRVRDPTKDNWKKMKLLCDYLEGRFKLHLVLKIDADGIPILKWSVDASFAVHEDFRSHTGGVLKASQQGGGLDQWFDQAKVKHSQQHGSRACGCRRFYEQDSVDFGISKNARALPRTQYSLSR